MVDWEFCQHNNNNITLKDKLFVLTPLFLVTICWFQDHHKKFELDVFNGLCSLLCGNSQVVDLRFVMDILAFNDLNLRVIFQPGDSFEHYQSVFLRHSRHSSAKIRLPTPVLTGLKERVSLFLQSSRLDCMPFSSPTVRRVRTLNGTRRISSWVRHLTLRS